MGVWVGRWVNDVECWGLHLYLPVICMCVSKCELLFLVSFIFVSSAKMEAISFFVEVHLVKNKLCGSFSGGGGGGRTTTSVVVVF